MDERSAVLKMQASPGVERWLPPSYSVLTY